MAFVQQICEGYQKKTLIGNWHQQRLYPSQPFRDNIHKESRRLDEGISCLDGRGFQRALPRLQRRSKWQTTGRVILDEGVAPAPSTTKASYPHGEVQAALQPAKRPFDKASEKVFQTTLHPYSTARVSHHNYHVIDGKNTSQITKPRNVTMYGSDFRSSLPQHPNTVKFTNYVSEHRAAFQDSNRNRTVSEFHRPAGNFNRTPEQSVKPITTLTCENWRENNDVKDRTSVQRSWLPQRDKALSFSMGQTAASFRGGSKPVNDIQTNTNINIGVQNLHPTMGQNNCFRRVRQDVTVTYNKTFSNRP